MAYKLLKRPIEWFKDSRPFDNSTKNDATTQKIYHFVNTTSSRVTEYVQSLNQSHPYSISYFGKIFSIVFTQIDSFNKKEEQQAYQRIILNPIFVLTISLHQCCRAIPHFRNIHEEFMRHNSIDAQLAKIKTELETIFMSYCQGQVEFSCISKLSCIMFEGMRNLLSTILNEEIVSLFRDDSDHGDIFKKRSSLQIQVLKELANKENFDDYISYILDPISFFTNWIKNQMSVYCSRETVVDKIHSTILRPKIESFSRDYCSSLMKCFDGVSSGGDVQFKELIVKYYESVKELVSGTPLSSFDILFVFDNPISNHEKFVNHFSKYFQNLIEEEDWKVWIVQVLSKNPNYRIISDNLLQCESFCPFCSEPCLLSSASHEHYCSSLHRPQGIHGWRNVRSKKFVTNDCNIELNRRSRFIFEGVTYKMEDYRTVNEHFSSWKIFAQDAVESKYWKWVFYRFRNEFMEFYKYENNEEIKNWSDLTKEDAISHLYRNFNSTTCNNETFNSTESKNPFIIFFKSLLKIFY